MPARAPGRAPGPARAERLAALVRDLGDRIRPGGPREETPGRLPTGIPDLDRLLAGGLPRGRLAEITGGPGSGRTALALTLLSEATRGGETVAVVDAADAFDPVSATAAGVELPRVLWVRAPGLREALRSSERLLEARGFALVLLDLCGEGLGPRARASARARSEAQPSEVLRPGASAPRGSPDPRRLASRRLAPARSEAQPSEAPSVWMRLARRARATGTVLVLLTPVRRVATCAAVAIEMQAEPARFVGPPDWLDGLDARLVLTRSRCGPIGGETVLQLRSDLAKDAT